ncbi:MAG: replicative DNA helicase [candidate division NC10 bacterium RIFCSPLOWO2_12_FULL_66_18]|nr:MAG: replicative DNA helicase [candidate division NC10 bacterium RIFCSPLOWO2_12_FULL_66_18]
MPEPALISDRIPPQNLEAEISILGAVLQDPAALLKAMEVLRAADFYKEAHRKIFSACIDLFERNEPVDLVTLANELMRRKQLEEVGGASALSSLVDAVPTAANIAYHARIVKDKALLYALIQKATAVVSRAYADKDDVDEVLDWAEQQIFEISQDKISRSFVPVKSVLKGTFQLIEKLYDRKSHVTGVPTGFKKFDEMTAGLQPSELIVVAGRPSMGKTSFCLNVAQHAAIHEQTPVAIFSLEMSKEQLVQRMLCSVASVDSHKLRTGYLSDADWPKLTTGAGRLSEAPIFIDDTPGISLLEMRAKARRLMAEQQLGLVIIDYLQLISGRGRAESRQQEISEISRSLKAMAKDLNVPVVALSQLSRAVEARQPPRPLLSDLRESGAIEQDADVVIFLYRPAFYRTRKDEELEEPEDNTTEVIIGKQRNGPTGTVHLAFLREYTRFEDQEREREFPGEPPEAT